MFAHSQQHAEVYKISLQVDPEEDVRTTFRISYTDKNYYTWNS